MRQTNCFYPSMKILIADDDPILLKTLELRLKKEGHQVVVTSDGREALKALDQLNVDLVITDLMMPFSSGLEIVARVKAGNGKTPVIVLSAMGHEKAVQEAFRFGANDYLTKPLCFNELSEKIKRLVLSA